MQALHRRQPAVGLPPQLRGGGRVVGVGVWSGPTQAFDYRQEGVPGVARGALAVEGEGGRGRPQYLHPPTRTLVLFCGPHKPELSRELEVQVRVQDHRHWHTAILHTRSIVRGLHFSCCSWAHSTRCNHGSTSHPPCPREAPCADFACCGWEAYPPPDGSSNSGMCTCWHAVCRAHARRMPARVRIVVVELALTSSPCTTARSPHCPSSARPLPHPAIQVPANEQVRVREGPPTSRARFSSSAMLDVTSTPLASATVRTCARVWGVGGHGSSWRVGVRGRGRRVVCTRHASRRRRIAC